MSAPEETQAIIEAIVEAVRDPRIHDTHGSHPRCRPAPETGDCERCGLPVRDAAGVTRPGPCMAVPPRERWTMGVEL